MAGASLNSELDSAHANCDRHSTIRHDDFAQGTNQPLEDTPPPQGLRSRPSGNGPGLPAKPHEAGGRGFGVEELTLLQAENEKLRREASALMKQFVVESAKKVQFCEDLNRDAERLLEEKSEVIRELHAKIAELQAQPGAERPSDADLLALEEELEQDRLRLKDDEQALMKQMREMEVQMSRERADLARQRNDLQRLHNEIRHELELAARDSDLRDRLGLLQRRYQELSIRKGGEPTRETPTQPDSATAAETIGPRRQGESSIFRRFFG